jgi:glycosyltransferase involved in cell wall biosynthesis
MLRETLNSVLNQSFFDFEIIVSNDNPERALSGETLGIDDRRITFLNQAINLGELGNMNFLLSASRGKYFTWIADDDLYRPEFLSSVYEVLNKFSFPECVYTSFEHLVDSSPVKSKEQQYGEVKLFESAEFVRRYWKNQIRVIGVMGVFDREYLIRMGGLEDVSCDGRGMFCEYLLLMRVAATLKTVVYIEAPLILYRLHNEAWGLKNTDVDMYGRASDTLIKRSLDVLRVPPFNKDFCSNLYGIVKLCSENYVAVLFRSKRSNARSSFLFHLVSLWKYTYYRCDSAHLFLLGLVAVTRVELPLVANELRYKIGKALHRRG